MPQGREHVSATVAGDRVDLEGQEHTPKFANIAVASSGDNTIVAAVATKKIRVLSLFVVAAGDVTVYFVDGANTAVAGDGTNGLTLTSSSGFTLNENRFGWFETAAGQSLDINLDGATTVGGSLTYIEV